MTTQPCPANRMKPQNVCGSFATYQDDYRLPLCAILQIPTTAKNDRTICAAYPILVVALAESFMEGSKRAKVSWHLVVALVEYGVDLHRTILHLDVSTNHKPSASLYIFTTAQSCVHDLFETRSGTAFLSIYHRRHDESTLQSIAAAAAAAHYQEERG